MAELSLEGIHFYYGRNRVLTGVDLLAGPGECCVLFGRNGAGKSTLLSILATRRRPTHGRYVLNGHLASEDGDLIRGMLLYLGHANNLYGHLSALENLRFFADLRGMRADDQELRQVVEAVGLGRAMDRPVFGFSAGMRKRLALARVLLARPVLLLLDEPYSALDTQGVGWLNGALRSYMETGGTLVLATHDPERVAALPHRTMRIEAGKMVEIKKDQDAEQGLA